MEAEYEGYRFTDANVVNPRDYDPEAGWLSPYDYNPFLIYNEYGTLAVVFAQDESDALDKAADSGKLKGHAVSSEDYDGMTEEEREELAYIGNASEPYDQTYLGIKRLPNPALSFATLFQASQNKGE